MNHLRAASRHSLKGAAPADGQSPIRGALVRVVPLRIGVCMAPSSTTGLLRTEAVASRRGVGTDWGRLS